MKLNIKRQNSHSKTDYIAKIREIIMSKNKQSKEKDVLTTQEHDKKCCDIANFASVETIDPNWHKLLTGEDFILPNDVREELAELELADLNDYWNRSYGGNKRKTR